MRERYFLKIDGIDGGSADATHVGEIDVVSWSWGMTAGTGSGGGGSGKAVFQDFHFVAQISRASPELVRAATTGAHLRSAVLSGLRAPGKARPVDFLRYELTDVIVTGVQHLDSAAVPTEQFSLAYAAFEISFTPQSTSGAAEPPISFAWDLKRSRTP